MLTQPTSVSDALVSASLERGWGIRCVELAYLPMGAGSHHWRAVGADGVAWFLTVDDVRTKPWLGDDVTVAARRLDAALGVPLQLREREGIDVVAPVPARGGRPTLTLDDAVVLSVTPWVDGVAGPFSTSWCGDGSDDVLDQLARVHVVEPPSGLHVAPLLPERASLRAMLGALGVAWTDGPYSDQARAWLITHADDVVLRLGELEVLERSWTQRPLVATHGEPHPGNVLVTGRRRRLVDWDTAALAPPERDLWWFREGDLSGWTARTGTVVDLDLLTAYALAWSLADVTSYVAELRAPHDDTDDARTALERLTAQDVSMSVLDH